MASDAVTEARQALGRELKALREAAGITQQNLADMLGYSRPRVAGAEKGDGCALLFWQGCDKVLNAQGSLIAGFERVETLKRREAANAAIAAKVRRESLVSALRRDADSEGLSGFSGRSHKFIAAYIGSEAVERVSDRIRPVSASPPQWMECAVAEVGHSSGGCRLYLWPFGVAIFHLVEDLDMPNIAKLALWRIRSYAENLAWATAHLQALGASDSATASYVLSCYWIDGHGWSERHLDTALQIISTPRVLLQREQGRADVEQAQAEAVERRLLASGFEHTNVMPFGLGGVSVGYASWSGVVYFPLAPEQSLAESNVICCELATQAVWAFCEQINRQVEDGHDPIVPDRYGWRFLRGVRSRLVNPRPQETGQHRAMRDAIIETSGLMGHLDQAIDVLHQTHGR